MVVVAALRGALGVTARPGRHVHGKDRRVGGRQAAREQVAQPLGVDAPAGQRGIDAAPAALVDWFQAQVRQRGERLGAKQRVAELEQGVGAAGVAGVQLRPEHAKPHEGEGWHRHGRAA